MRYRVVKKHTNKSAGIKFHTIGEEVSLTVEEAEFPLKNGMIKKLDKEAVKPASEPKKPIKKKKG